MLLFLDDFVNEVFLSLLDIEGWKELKVKKLIVIFNDLM